MMPRTVILDPATTIHTPEWLFLSTGIRAVDHAVEGICSINAQPLSDGTSMHALRLLGRGLRSVKTDPCNLDARLEMFAAGYLTAKPVADRIFERVWPLPAKLVKSLEIFQASAAAPKPDDELF